MNSKYEDTIKKNGEDRTERNIKSSAVSIETMNFDAAQSETDAVQRAALSALAIEGKMLTAAEDSLLLRLRVRPGAAFRSF